MIVVVVKFRSTTRREGWSREPGTIYAISTMIGAVPISVGMARKWGIALWYTDRVYNRLLTSMATDIRALRDRSSLRRGLAGCGCSLLS